MRPKIRTKNNWKKELSTTTINIAKGTVHITISYTNQQESSPTCRVSSSWGPSVWTRIEDDCLCILGGNMRTFKIYQKILIVKEVIIIGQFALAHQNREKDCDRGSKGRGQEELICWVNWKCFNVSENLFWTITFVNFVDIDVEYLVVWGKREDQRQPEGLQQCQPKYACPCTFGWSKGSNCLGSIMSVLT